MTLRDRLESIVSQTRVEDVWTVHCQLMADYGFDRLLYGASRLKTPETIGDLKDALLLSNHDPAYLERYLSEGYILHAPTFLWASENDGARPWSEGLPDTDPQSASHRAAVIDRDFGIAAGYTISFRKLAYGAFAAIGLAASAGLSQRDVEDIWAKHGQDILMINRVMHLTVSTLPAHNANRLTPRQREVLELVANGHTIMEISALIGRKPATVEKHLRLAREAMNAETTPHAVLKAAIQNHIFTKSHMNAIDLTNR